MVIIYNYVYKLYFIMTIITIVETYDGISICWRISLLSSSNSFFWGESLSVTGSISKLCKLLEFLEAVFREEATKIWWVFTILNMGIKMYWCTSYLHSKRCFCVSVKLMDIFCSSIGLLHHELVHSRKQIHIRLVGGLWMDGIKSIMKYLKKENQ